MVSSSFFLVFDFFIHQQSSNSYHDHLKDHEFAYWVMAAEETPNEESMLLYLLTYPILLTLPGCMF